MKISHRLVSSRTCNLAMFALGLIGLISNPARVLSQQQDESAKTTETQLEKKREWFNKPSGNYSDTTSAALLQKLQETRPYNALISSKRSRELQARGKPKLLLPEGTRLVDRVGYIRYEKPWWIFVPSRDDNGNAMRMLPSEWLEVMIRSSVGSTEPLLFSLSGEVTEFEGDNYLLAHAVSRIESPQKIQDVAPSGSGIASDAPIDDVVARLRNVNPQQKLLTPTDSPFPPMPKFAAPALPSVRPEGTPMIHRPGRLIEESPWWTFVLETSSRVQGQLPLKLLPSRNLELMIHNMARGDAGVVFLVSGQLTRYHGENFLHVQAVTRQVDIGNLRK